MHRFVVFAALMGSVALAKETQEPKPNFVGKAMEWLAKAQHESGGWGAGSHAKQNIRNPAAVKTDPATTAFAAMALLRAGHTPTSGKYKDHVARATMYLVKVVEAAPEKGPRITDVRGTQPQAKMGQLVDTSMTLHLLARVLTVLDKKHELYARVDKALDKCIQKVQGSQAKDGSWSTGGGWAPVLQSSIGCSALELARAAGKKVDDRILKQAREYQQGNVTVDGKVKAEAKRAGAGVDLYVFVGSVRGAAGQARAALDVFAEAKDEGRIRKDAELSEKTLIAAGLPKASAAQYFRAWKQTTAQVDRLSDEQLLKGFGNNGGEEFLSYLMTSESLVILGGEKWTKWNSSMHRRLARIQNNDGSWSGHHCITSPVFCTAAVVQTLNVANDKALLRRIAKQDQAIVKTDTK